MTSGEHRQGPLAGVKVLDLSRMFPGAMCTSLLADLGAEVLKVEGPGAGDGLRRVVAPGAFNAAHTALNRGKRSLVLDLKKPGAAAVLTRLVEGADIVIESHRPGQLDTLGMGYEAMSARNPRIVWCSVTGFGDRGPHAQATGHDITFLGYSGLLSKLADGPTTPPDTTISIPLAASLAAVGILAAYSDAQRTGRGRRVEANMSDSSMWVLTEDFARAANSPGPGWGTFAARNVYTCADGREVTVAATEPRSWAALCEGLGTPEIAGHRLGDEDAPVTARLTEVFRTRTAAEWCANPGLAGGVGPVNDLADLIDEDGVVQRRSKVTLPASGSVVLANPLRFDGADGEQSSHALTEPPALGADTDAALSAAGFSADEIAALHTDDVVG